MHKTATNLSGPRDTCNSKNRGFGALLDKVADNDYIKLNNVEI